MRKFCFSRQIVQRRLGGVIFVFYELSNGTKRHLTVPFSTV
nr:MAG TPA: hypothetical protein [Caudoviricetes sp.]DAS72406.1 MAG TPA: hypothetical protein [Caudoviricetes sp.]